MSTPRSQDRFELVSAEIVFHNDELGSVGELPSLKLVAAPFDGQDAASRVRAMRSRRQHENLRAGLELGVQPLNELAVAI